MLPLDRRTAFARNTQWLALALQQRLLTTTAPPASPFRSLPWSSAPACSRLAARSVLRRKAEPPLRRISQELS
jgi:hypothetical protein